MSQLAQRNLETLWAFLELRAIDQLLKTENSSRQKKEIAKGDREVVHYKPYDFVLVPIQDKTARF